VTPGSKRALIIGGSLAGLFAANLLRKQGWQISIYERTQGDLASRGAGIGTYRQLFDIMASLGIQDLEAKCIPLKRRLCFGPSGEVVHEVNKLHTMSAWATIYNALRDLVLAHEYHSGKQLVTIEQANNRVTAIFSDGSRETGDLLVGADGLRSTVRQHFAPEIEPIYAGYVAWRGMVDENDFSPEDHAQIFENYAFGFPEGEQFLAYPVLGRTNENIRGKRSYNFVWYRPASEAQLTDLCTDEHGVCHGSAIAPPLIRKELIVGIKAAAKKLLAPQLARIVCQVPQPFFQAINDLESKRLVFGRVALIGDAAFIARPHVGGGITKAAIDAQTLAQALAAQPDNIDQALSVFETQSLHFGGEVVDRSRGLGAYLEGQHKPFEARTPIQQSRDIKKVMQEQGAALTNELLNSTEPAH
jgi:2-polyprenyl-6-methoxyphenol hydroxylase-like FAD-dependent oxidoreductase